MQACIVVLDVAMKGGVGKPLLLAATRLVGLGVAKSTYCAFCDICMQVHPHCVLLPGRCLDAGNGQLRLPSRHVGVDCPRRSTL